MSDSDSDFEENGRRGGLQLKGRVDVSIVPEAEVRVR